VDDEIQFYQTVFQELDAAITGLLHEYEHAHGSDFRLDDVKWHEKTTPENVVEGKLLWRETPMLEMQLCLTTFRCQCQVVHAVRRH
jgi:hypothetical protein